MSEKAQALKFVLEFVDLDRYREQIEFARGWAKFQDKRKEPEVKRPICIRCGFEDGHAPDCEEHFNPIAMRPVYRDGEWRDAEEPGILT
jgi:hypothetical protein